MFTAIYAELKIYSCTNPEADVVFKQIGWQHVNIVEKHLQKKCKNQQREEASRARHLFKELCHRM